MPGGLFEAIITFGQKRKNTSDKNLNLVYFLMYNYNDVQSDIVQCTRAWEPFCPMEAVHFSAIMAEWRHDTDALVE